jgi:hypothetical protein
MTLLRMETTLTRIKGLGVLCAIAAAIAWGVACGVFRAPYPLVVIGGLATAALGFWLERGVLASPETRQRKDFQLILAAGYGFFAFVGIGLVALANLLSIWYLPRL